MERIMGNNRAWIDETWNKLDKKLSKVCIRSRDKLPYTSFDGVHDDRRDDINCWTNGFWGGLMWLMYVGTGNEEYKKTANRSEELMDGALANYELLHHDVGFMWHILSGANYRITGDAKAKTRNLYAASVLFSRYNLDGEYIRAWNGKECEGWSIIDCMMNIPLLYWASKEIGDDRFKKVAMKHADMTICDHIRADGSINHIVEHRTDSVGAVKAYTGQGYSEESCWTRGLAWAIYGTVLSYIYTKKSEYLEAAIKTADYFIAHSSDDFLTPVDFKQPDEPVLYDSTAGLCAACGMIELANILGNDGKKYLQTAVNILKATDREFCDYSSDTDSVVLMGTERYPHNKEEEKGVHIPIIYADFFFAEALLKLKGNDFLIW